MTKDRKRELREFRPSEFMRARRPELFSDSSASSQPRLSRQALEYQLDTLTSRKEETEFEHFCRRLAERELCPNLIPQTGPTGGGDSKVDSETYPVADAISLRWYEGVAREADRERWAFAFSAKKEWRAKVKADVKKIAQTKRDYKLIYFMTNQFVPDKARAEVEDNLKKVHRIEVRILDRTWIVNRVISNDRVQLAIDALKLTDYSEAQQRTVGPHDTKRERDLGGLEQEIEEPGRYDGVEYQYVEDCLEAAILARALEKPRVEVDGRFDRAKRVAEQFGNRQQQLRVAYTRAWTAFWWYDDFVVFNQLYADAEIFAVGSAQATDLGLLTTLWQMLRSAIDRDELSPEAAKLDQRTSTLTVELDRLAGEPGRPNNALEARTSKLLMRLHSSMGDAAGLDDVLRECKEIVAAGEQFPSYPMKVLIGIVRELGDVLTDSLIYDELFESVVSLVERRSSEGEAGRALLAHGFRKLRAGRRYEAIRVLGRAQLHLAKHEYRGDAIAALAGCGAAYESAGLLWAARTNMLAAANQALAEFWKHGELIPQTLPTLQRLVWIELQLGRLPWILTWVDAASVIANQLMLKEKEKEQFRQERDQQDLALGVLLLRCGVWDAKWLDFLPQGFWERDLNYSWMMCLYVLGYEEKLRAEGAIPESESAESIRSLLWELVNQPGSEHLGKELQLQLESEVTFRSVLLGCEIKITASNTLVATQLAETILGVLEAFLSTSLGERIFPYRSSFRMTVRPSSFDGADLECRVVEGGGEAMIEIRHPAQIRYGAPDEQKAFHEWLLKVLAETIPRIAVVDNASGYLERLARDEVAFGRAVDLAYTSVCVKNILGDGVRHRLSDWDEVGSNRERFPLRRSTRWDTGLAGGKTSEQPETAAPTIGKGAPPPELFDVERLRHQDRRVLSVIDVPLWDRAKWTGTVYQWSAEPNRLPWLALGFRDEVAAREIFQGLQSRLGKVDTDERLSVSIITGVDKQKPSSYCVVVSTNLLREARGARGNTQLIVVSRINRMDPQSSRNLDAFLDQFGRTGKYILLPAHFISPTTAPKVFENLGIEKRELRVRQAWQLGVNDPDAVALQPDDDPIIPEGVSDAPVFDALKEVRKRRSRRAP